MPRAALSVRVRCWYGADSAEDPLRPGARLADAIEAELTCVRWSADDVDLQRICCMSQCRRPCVVAFTHPLRFTYLFGDLAPATGPSPVVACFLLWLKKPDGYISRDEWPPSLRAGRLARIPPLGSVHQLVSSVCRLPRRPLRQDRESQE